MALAGLAGIASYTMLLGAVAVLCLGCLALVARGLRRTTA